MRFGGACFDYKPFETVVNGQTIEDRLYNCWQNLEPIMKSVYQSDLLEALRELVEIPNYSSDPKHREAYLKAINAIKKATE